jgi:acyl-ACP thioesterase
LSSPHKGEAKVRPYRVEPNNNKRKETHMKYKVKDIDSGRHINLKQYKSWRMARMILREVLSFPKLKMV